MKSQVKVMGAYLLVLLLSSFLFNASPLEDRYFSLDGRISSLFNPIMLISVTGGLLALWLTLPRRMFFFFLVFYASLWFIKFPVFFLSEKIGVVTLGANKFNMSIILPRYFNSITRLATPFPFIIFWLVQVLFFEWKNVTPKIKET